MKEQKESTVRVTEALRRIFFYFKQLGIVPIYFIASVIFSSVATFFNVMGLALLYPLIRGLIEGDYSAIVAKFGVTEILSRISPNLNSSKACFFIILGLILVSIVIKNLLQYFGALSINQQQRAIDHNLRTLIVGRYLTFGKMYFDHSRLALITDIITRGSQAISGQLSPLVNLFTQVLSLCLYACIMFYISYKLTFVVILILPVRYFLTNWLTEHIKKISHEMMETGVSLKHHVINAFVCISLVKSYAAEEMEKTRIVEASYRDANAEFEMQKKKLLVRPIQDLTTLLTLLLVVSAMGLIAKDFGARNVSLFLAYFFVLRKAIPCMGVFANFRFALARNAALIEKLQEVFFDEDKYLVKSGSLQFEGLQKQIDFKGLNFSYRADTKVIDNFNLTIEKGKMTALVGATGAGKTTIAHLLMRFYDVTPNCLFIDGRDIRDFSISSLMNKIAIVMQDPFLLHASLKENIIYGLKTVPSDDEIQKAIDNAQLTELVERLPDGLNTLAGHRGAQLSGGERQRVSLARAFLKNAPIVILDEATSALDTRTEKKILDAMNRVASGRTSIVIAHRLSTIVNADKIAVVDKGRVVESGTLDELLKKQGLFYEFWNAQRVTTGLGHEAVAGSIV